MYKFKKKIAFLLVVGLLLGSLTGCGTHAKQSSAQKGTEAEKGRYVEIQIDLPEGVDSSQVFQIGKKEDALCIYTTQMEEGTIHFAGYSYQEGNYQEMTPAWLKNIRFAEEQISTYGEKKVIEAANGKYYFFCTITEGDNAIGHLYCSSDGNTVTEITPSDWLVENEEYHFYECPQDIGILEDGTIVAYFPYKIKIYKEGTGAISLEIPLKSQHTEQVVTQKNTFYLTAQNDNLEFAGVEVYQAESDKPQETITMDTSLGNSNYLDILSDGSMVVTGRNGIMERKAAGAGWSLVVNGIYTSFAMESMWCMGMTALDSEIYYALFSDDSGERRLMKYAYDPEAAKEPETTLTVYSLYDNAAVKQAAAMYTKQHPGVLVSVETGIPAGEEESTDINTVLQNLNTKLLAGEGADILVLDGTVADSFMEKGMLADISSIITPMAEEGVLLKNIADTYTAEDGKVYRMPLKFSMNLLIGNKLDAQKAATLEGMAQEMAKQKEPILGSMTPQDFADTFVPYLTTDIVADKKLNQEVLAEKLEVLKTIAQNGGLIENYPEEEPKWSIWNIAAEGGATFYDTAGFLQAMLPMAAVKLVNGSFSNFEGTFRPIGEMSINASCIETEAAQDFLKFAFSMEMQDGDFYDGFPVNVEALENQITKDRSDYAAYTEIETADGSYTGFTIDVISQENAKALLELCKMADHQAGDDTKIVEVFAEVLPAYVNGSSSLEETLGKIEKGLNMYLAE